MSKRGFIGIASFLIGLALMEFILALLSWQQIGNLNAIIISEFVLVTLTLSLCVFMFQQMHNQHIQAQYLAKFEHHILLNLSEAVIQLDADRRICYWNPAAEQMYGWREVEVVGKHIHRVLKTQHLHTTRQQVLQQLLEDGNWHGEVIHYHKNGTRLHVAASVDKIHNLETEIHYIAIFMDVTEQRRAEDKAHKHQRELTALLQNAPLGLLSVDVDGTITEAHGQCIAEIAQTASPQTLIGQRLEVAFAHQPKLLQRSQYGLAGSVMSNTLEVEQSTYDVRYHPQRHEDDNQVTGLFITAVDTTERRAADEALQRYAIRLETLHQMDKAILALASPIEIAQTAISHIPYLTPYLAGCILLYDKNQQVSHASFQWYQGEIDILPPKQFPQFYVNPLPILYPSLEAYNLAQVPQTPLTRLFADLGAVAIAVKPLMNGNEISGVMIASMPNDGILGTENREILNELGNTLALAIQQIEMKQKVAEYTQYLENDLVVKANQVHINKGRSEALLRSSSDAIALTNFDGEVIETNPAFLYMFGYVTAPSDDERLPLDRLTNPEGWQLLQETMADAVIQRTSQYVQIKMTRGANDWFTAAIAISPVIDIFNDTDGLVLNVRDITEQIREEEALRLALHREREVNNLRNRFISTVSHEFRTPLTVIQSSIELLDLYLDRAYEDKPQQVNTHVQRIIAAISEMRGLLTDVSNVQEVNNYQQLVDIQSVDLPELITQIVDSIQFATAYSHNINIQFEDSRLIVEGNVKLLRQIISNLVTNATKYSEPDTHVNIIVRSSSKFITIEVQDEGIGIPFEEQNHILEPFYRAGNVDAKQGTGLGLSIVKQAVDLHGGTIDFESTPGQGATFTITLPTRQLTVIEVTGE